MWVCDTCDFEIEQTRVHFNTPDALALKYIGPVPMCPECITPMKEETQNELGDGKTFNINGAPYSKPLHSDALGIQPDQVAEHREKFPNIEIDSQNRPVFNNTSEHQDYMDKCGIVKHKQKIKPKGKTITTLKTNS